ncbi:MAG: hypothetical protein VXY89_14955, partial [SAR324 cluster bacterium]|nr:hypothetical protein [SAR324 cluster bacterium]
MAGEHSASRYQPFRKSAFLPPVSINSFDISQSFRCAEVLSPLYLLFSSRFSKIHSQPPVFKTS